MTIDIAQATMILSFLAGVVGLSAALNRYMARGIRKELMEFQVRLFKELDQRYVSNVAYQMHLEQDKREHDQFREQLKRLENNVFRARE
jgi:hypothetical protein